MDEEKLLVRDWVALNARYRAETAAKALAAQTLVQSVSGILTGRAMFDTQSDAEEFQKIGFKNGFKNRGIRFPLFP